MEKVIKKRKSKKGLRKRIGIIAVGGLSLVLTVCLSVGATLAWFAGSTWASKNLYMGGPVYVEMAGRGTSGSTAGSGTDEAKWVGGDGKLDIEAAATRTTGTAALKVDGPDEGTDPDIDLNDVLLPGQKVQVYTQARVFSTAETTTVDANSITNESSGANTTNTSNGKTEYRNEKGRVTTTTTSVLRARFSIEVEFDPGMGFNNFTDSEYRAGYPVQSQSGFDAALSAGVVWDTKKTDEANKTAGARRDGIDPGTTWVKDAAGDLAKLRTGDAKSIYQWRYCSYNEWLAAGGKADGTATGAAMGKPFNGKFLETGETSTIPYYAIWVTSDGTAAGAKVESDAFYKARCNTYLGTYKEFYVNEYGNTVTRTVASSVAALEANLNAQFVKLVNDSSDAIINKVKATSYKKRAITGAEGNGLGYGASWLYIDPSIGNDTNTDEISTSVGGWWYLVASDDTPVGSTGAGGNKIFTAVDSAPTTNLGDRDTNGKHTGTPGTGVSIDESGNYKGTNTITTDTEGFTRYVKTKDGESGIKENDDDRLDARLFEIIPSQELANEVVTKNSGTEVLKIVSDAFPFVNGTFALPADALTNLFANAKITFKVAFQALQAFFPYTETIDKVDYKDSLLGAEKALSIRNAIPIYNEAFDYQENAGGAIEGL